MTLLALLALVAIAAASTLALAPAPAEAAWAYGTHITYYDGPQHAQKVGYRYYTCEGVLEEQWGVTSPYYTSSTHGCTID